MISEGRPMTVPSRLALEGGTGKGYGLGDDTNPKPHILLFALARTNQLCHQDLPSLLLKRKLLFSKLIMQLSLVKFIVLMPQRKGLGLVEFFKQTFKRY